MNKNGLIALIVIGLLGGRAFGASDGKALYLKDCKECHGDTGNGKGATGSALNPKVKQDLSDATVQAKLTDDQISKAITDGVRDEDHQADGKIVMKPLKDKDNLSTDDLKALIQYVRSLKK